MLKKGKNDNTVVNTITDFEDTILWMSMRYWMRNSKLYDDDENYPEKFIDRYWYSLLPIQQEKFINDVKREKEYGWGSDIKRIDILLETFNKVTEKSYILERGYWEYPKCDDFEFLLIRMAISYACGRQTIAAVTLPENIIEHRYKYLSDEQKNIIVSDLECYLDYLEKNGMKRKFGNERIDDNTWQKFMTALDRTKNEEIELTNGETVTVFRTTSLRGHWNEEKRINEFAEEEVIYPLNEYLKNPHREIFIPKENIKW